MAPTTRQPTSNRVDDSRWDETVPTEDNESKSDIALATDAISDKLEYAVHRSGLTPRLKILMAALRHMRDFGDVKFKTPANLLRFLQGDGLQVFPASDMEPAYAPPMPMPSFARPRQRR